MKEYAVEAVTGLTMAHKATEIMNRYASQGWIVLRTESVGNCLVIVFERDRKA
jgi:hypothetical protein